MNFQGRGQETAEKQQPSALDFVALFNIAMDDNEKQCGRKIALTHNITMAVNEYNKTVSVKKWKVDANKKKIIANLLRCPHEVLDILSTHYDQHKHAVSGLLVACAVFDIVD